MPAGDWRTARTIGPPALSTRSDAVFTRAFWALPGAQATPRRLWVSRSIRARRKGRSSPLLRQPQLVLADCQGQLAGKLASGLPFGARELQLEAGGILQRQAVGACHPFKGAQVAGADHQPRRGTKPARSALELRPGEVRQGNGDLSHWAGRWEGTLTTSSPPDSVRSRIPVTMLIAREHTGTAWTWRTVFNADTVRGLRPCRLVVRDAARAGAAPQYIQRSTASPGGACRRTCAAICRTISAHVKACHECPFAGRPYVNGTSRPGETPLRNSSNR